MRFIEVELEEPEKHVVALADAYFFPPYNHSLYVPPTLPRPASKSNGMSATRDAAAPHRDTVGPVLRLPPREARVCVYNKKSNETAVWVVELLEVHAVARGGHHRGRVKSKQVVENVQPSMVRRLRGNAQWGRPLT